MKQTFALIHTWPELRNAEYEVLHRIVMAAEQVEKSVVVIDNDGIILWASRETRLTVGQQLPPDAVDFLVSLHFASPRVIDVYSYYALWQPISFYYDFGYQRSVDRFTSHNDMLSCASDIADSHALNLLGGLRREPLNPLPKLFHNLPEPYLEPNIDEDSRLLYIGINWERIGRPRGRFHDALILLDKAGLTDIYGPELVHGVAPWEGYSTYRGELPFDGKSVKSAINRAGICLALSSAQHKATGVMSNRLFEGLAGGAAIIANSHPLIDKYFSDVVYQVDDSQGDAALGRQIIEVLNEIRSDPETARKRTLVGQQILRDGFSLEASINELFTHHETRLHHFEAGFLAEAEVTVVLTIDRGTRADFLRQLRLLQRQKKVRIRLELICEDSLLAEYDGAITMIDGSVVEVQVHAATFASTPAELEGSAPIRTKTGPIIGSILASRAKPYVLFLESGEYPFSDHIASLVRAIEDTPDACMACSGVIREVDQPGRAARRVLDDLRFADLDSIALVSGLSQKGRFLYRTDLFSTEHISLMSLLDGEEHRYFRLAGLLEGPLAQTNYSTYLYNEVLTNQSSAVGDALESQQQFIRDRFARDPRWIEKLIKGNRIPQFVYAYSPGTPVRWSDQRVPQGVGRRIEPGHMYPTRAGGEGLAYLSVGFCEPEATHIWMGGQQGIIEFALPPRQHETGEDFELLLTCAGRRSLQTGREQHCTVAINGQVTSYVQVPDAYAETRIKIPPVLIGGNRLFRVELTPDHADQVFSDTGDVIDARHLSITFKSIGIVRSLVRALPKFKAGKTYKATRGTSGARGLAQGFHAPEAECAWIAGTAGTVAFALDQALVKPQLRLVMRGRPSIESGRKQTVSLHLDDHAIGSFELNDRPTPIKVDIDPALLAKREVQLRITPSHAEAVFDAQHRVVDSRLLGAALYSFEICDAAQSLLSKGGPGKLLSKLARRFA